jgi:undecaprenyl-diphosphatase
MTVWHVIVLAIVQGLAELLPVSSSAHVIVAEKLMRMPDATAPEMTLLLVMLHTGTMFAVIVYFWRRWAHAFFQSTNDFKKSAWAIIVATFLTLLVGGGLVELIEKAYLKNQPHAWVEQFFGRLDLIAPALAAVGILILVAGLHERRPKIQQTLKASEITPKQYGLIGVIQGFVGPFRGFSRSGATISTGMLAGVHKTLSEDFSFALAVVLTPLVDAREVWRLIQMRHLQETGALAAAFAPSILGAFFAFLAGLVALKWLSRWLETGRWYIFGIYCLVAAFAVGYLYHLGY